MIIRRLYTAYALLHFLEEDDPVSRQLRPLLTEHGRFPTRAPGNQRFETLPARLPALIACLGRHLLELLRPWAAQGHAAAVDSTPLRANGGVLAQETSAGRGGLRILRLTPKLPGVSPVSRLVVRLEAASGGRGRQRLHLVRRGVHHRQ